MIFPNGPNAVTVRPLGAVGARMSNASHNSVMPSRRCHPAKATSSFELCFPTDDRAPAWSIRSWSSGVTTAFFTFQSFDNIHLRSAAEAQIVLSAISAQYFSM
ncbi:hypothetical protein AJ88_29965 [Mesorhizobium amorphae CCBAU 01583]|nr:hypothetical protein AJ88_29965 [Mesorhizobium amorphae CCBAU 01583]